MKRNSSCESFFLFLYLWESHTNCHPLRVHVGGWRGARTESERKQALTPLPVSSLSSSLPSSSSLYKWSGFVCPLLSLSAVGRWSESRWVRLVSCAPQGHVAPMAPAVPTIQGPCLVANTGRLHLLRLLFLLFLFYCRSRGPSVCRIPGALKTRSMRNGPWRPHPLR